MWTDELRPLPFFFKRINSADSYLLTNFGGAFEILESSEELKYLIDGKYSSISDNTVNRLLAKNFLSEPREYSAKTNLLASRFASLLNNNITEPALFIVVPTLRCHHDCHYCQVSRVPLQKKGFDLDVEHIEKILKIITNVKSADIKIEFQGGEPLLAIEFIKEFVKRAEKRLMDKNVSYVICTSLTDLADDFLAWSVTKNIHFSVSLDGPELLHNFNRPSKLFNTFNKVSSNINKLIEHSGYKRVSCLTTITKKSFGFIDEIIDSYKRIGLSNIFLRPLSPFGFAFLSITEEGYTAAEYFLFYKSALDKIIELNDQDEFVEETALIHLNKIFRPFQSGYVDLRTPSGYYLGVIVINYDGNIFGSDEARMLYQLTKNSELVIGNLANEALLINNSSSRNILKNSFIASVPGCDECVYQPYCGADPLYHLATQGEPVGNKADSFFCKLERLTYDHLFDLYHNDKKARKVFSRWLSH